MAWDCGMVIDVRFEKEKEAAKDLLGFTKGKGRPFLLLSTKY
jgi:hypothetical protein